MCAMRVSDLTMLSTMQSSVANNREEYSNVMLQISTGSNYLNRSDNVSETEQAALLQISEDKYNQWIENLETAETWEEITDSSNQEILDIMQEISSIITEANSEVNSDSDLESLATEVYEYIEALIDLGNTTYNGSNIYAGTGSCDETFTSYDDDSDGIIDRVEYNGSSTQRKVSSSESSTISYGTLGTDLFEFEYTDDSGTTSTVDVFDELISLYNDLMSGTVDEDNLEKLEAAVDNVTAATVVTTSNENRIASAIDNLESLVTVTETNISEILDVDETEAITQYYAIEAALEAALEMISRINDMSILNYIN